MSLQNAVNLAHAHGAIVLTLSSGSGTLVERAEFPDTAALEFFMLEMIDNSMISRVSSKAIGTVLLMWQR